MKEQKPYLSTARNSLIGLYAVSIPRHYKSTWTWDWSLPFLNSATHFMRTKRTAYIAVSSVLTIRVEGTIFMGLV